MTTAPAWRTHRVIFPYIPFEAHINNRLEHLFKDAAEGKHGDKCKPDKVYDTNVLGREILARARDRNVDIDGTSLKNIKLKGRFFSAVADFADSEKADAFYDLLNRTAIRTSGWDSYKTKQLPEICKPRLEGFLKREKSEIVAAY